MDNKKICPKCKIREKYKKRSYCQECNKEYKKEYCQNNQERIKEKGKKYREMNKEKIKKRQEEYNNKPKVKERKKKYNKDYNKRYYPENKEKISKIGKKYRLENVGEISKRREKYEKEYNQRFEVKERKKKYNKDYYWRNKIIERERNKKYIKDRKRTDEGFKLKCNIRCYFNKALNRFTKTGKIMSSKKYGVDYKGIIEHLKPLPNNLKEYDIHHIKPLFTFNFINKDGSTNLEEVKRAFAPENHKLMLTIEHRKLNHNIHKCKEVKNGKSNIR